MDPCCDDCPASGSIPGAELVLYSSRRSQETVVRTVRSRAAASSMLWPASPFSRGNHIECGAALVSARWRPAALARSVRVA